MISKLKNHLYEKTISYLPTDFISRFHEGIEEVGLKNVLQKDYLPGMAIGKNIFLELHIDDDAWYSLTTIISDTALKDGNEKVISCVYFTFPQ